jgi:hypothetical protein
MPSVWKYWGEVDEPASDSFRQSGRFMQILTNCVGVRLLMQMQTHMQMQMMMQIQMQMQI